MKQRLKQFILWIKLIPAKIYDRFVKVKNYFDEFPEKTNSRSDLSSTNVNVRMLKNGLRNKNIKTIALLGNFSSGKSSIIFSALKNKRTLYIYPDEDFYKNKAEQSKTVLDCLIKNDILSISPQQETYRKYIKIKKLIKLYVVSFIVCLLISLIFVFLLRIFNNEFKEFMKKYLEIEIKNYWYIISPFFAFILIAIIGTIHICNYCISLKMNGLEVEQNAERAGVKKVNYSDESTFTCIIFHLLRRKIKYIVFEDLDREPYGNPFSLEIFGALRNFCLRINASPQIKKPIKFIYCFSDKIFKSTDNRLKTFDLIIPIFPKMSMNNAYEILKLQDIIVEKEIPDDELANLSLFIKDQRLYNSIIYEFRLMCNQIKSTDYKEIFALCCIKNLYPTLYYEMNNNYNFIDEIFQTMNGNLSKFEQTYNDLNMKLDELLKDLDRIEIINANLLIKSCIRHKYITSNYKNLIYSQNIILSKEDNNYLKCCAAMDKCDVNAKLTNCEMIITRVYGLNNPKCFNISLMKYCIENNKSNSLNLIFASLSNVESKEAINAILNSKDITDDEMLLLTQKLYNEISYINVVLDSKNYSFIHCLLKEHLSRSGSNVSHIRVEVRERIAPFYYTHPSYFIKLGINLCLFVLQNFVGRFKEIPMIEGADERQIIYKCIVEYNRCDMTVENLKYLYDDFENSPLHHIIGDQKIIECIAKQNNIDVIKDLNKGEDSIDDLINLFDITKINYSSLYRSKYIEGYKYSIDVEEKYYSFLEKLLQFDILKFSSFNIANCCAQINTENKNIEIGAFISRALDNNVSFDGSSKEKFSLELSSHLIMVLTKQYLSIIKDNIDTSIFNDASKLKEIDIDKIKLFESNINLSKDVIVNMLDNNSQQLKLILNECNAITIDKSNHSFDKERLEIAKKLKLNSIYGLFR